MNVYFIAFIVALGVTYLVTPSVKRLAIRWGAVDKPDARKVHKGIIPRLGGLAIYAGFIASVLARVHLTWELVGLLTGGTAILLLGVLDDIYQLPAKVKLVGQIAAASVLLLFDIQIDWLTNPFGDMIYLDMLATPITLIWVVSLTNTLNLIDGLVKLLLDGCTVSIRVCIVGCVDNLFFQSLKNLYGRAYSALGNLHHAVAVLGVGFILIQGADLNAHALGDCVPGSIIGCAVDLHARRNLLQALGKCT